MGLVFESIVPKPFSHQNVFKFSKHFQGFNGSLRSTVLVSRKQNSLNAGGYDLVALNWLQKNQDFVQMTKTLYAM